MVRVNDCCCGCSLRTGTLILLWISVIGGAIGSIIAVKVLPYFDQVYDLLGADAFYKGLIKLDTFASIVLSIYGMITAIFGIYGIQKNMAKCLTPVLYYYGLNMVHLVLFMLIALAYPKLYLYTSSLGMSEDENYALVGALKYIFGLGLTAYFFVVIKSFRDSMVEDASGRNVNATPNPYAPPPYCTKA